MKILAVDVYNLAFPNFVYAQDRPGVTSRNTLRSIKEAADSFAADQVILCIEGSSPSFRQALFPAYKASRGAPPEGFLEEVAKIVQAVEWAGWPVIDPVDAEADDALASIARQADAGTEVFLLTNDKDLMACISDRCHVVMKRAGKYRVFEASGCIGRMGVSPDKVSEFLALVGDTTDGIPGIPGIGEKKAIEILGQYESVDAALANPEFLSDRTKNLLTEGVDDFRLCLSLTRLRTNVDLGEALFCLQS